jgi:hypothetical protein
MKTAPMMIAFLPRFRWFVWGVGLCATLYGLVDGHFSVGILIMFLLGAITYPTEASNRRIIENDRRIAEHDRRISEMMKECASTKKS